MADEVKTEEKEVRVNPFQAEVDSKNKELGNSKGFRLFCGFTRGKGSIPFKYQGFDTDSAETLPSSMKEFMELTGIQKQEELLELVIDGYNARALTQASDPIAEYVNGNWDDDTKTQFRLIIRNMVKSMGLSIEEAANAIKPGVEKKFATAQVSK